jgi:uncharacterized protein (TIGR02172 family)
MNMRDIGSPIASGRTSDVYDWDDGKILKLYRPEYPEKMVDHERFLTEMVNRAGIPSPKVGQIVETEGRRGIVFEKIVGISMLKAMANMPWKIHLYAHMLAELQATLHAIRGSDELPDQRDRLAKKIRAAGSKLTQTATETVLGILDELPRGTSFCHSDFHPDNVMITQDGPMVIDFVDSCRGNPIGDVARTSVLFGMAIMPDSASHKWILNISRRYSHATYKTMYRRLHRFEKKEFEKWRVVNAAARLCEHIPEERRLVDYIDRFLDRYSSRESRPTDTG